MTKLATVTGRGHSAHHVGDPLPSVMLLSTLAEVIGISYTQSWELEQKGIFEFLELKPAVGNRKRYSGAKVQAWLRRENAEAGGADTITADVPLRFFGSTRKRR